MVGRSDAFESLADAWRRVRTGEEGRGAGRVAIVLGDEGAGKSRFAGEFARYVRAERRRTIVVESRVFEAERDVSHSTLRGLVQQLVDVPALATAPPAMLAALAGIAPALVDRFRHLAREAPDPDIARAFARVVADVAHDTPIVLVIDDAADADVASSLALAELCRRPPAGLFLVMTGRSAAWARSTMAKDAAQGAAHVVRIELQSLGRDDVLAMLASIAPLGGDAPALAARLHEQSGGNPGQLHLLFTHLVDRGVVAPDAEGRWRLTRQLDDSDLSLPAAARDAVRSQLNGLSADARRLVDAAAVAGPRSDSALLEVVSALPPESFQPALGELLVTRVLRESTSHPSTFEFASEASRQTVYDLIAPSARRAMHRAAYRALSATRGGAVDEAATRHRRAASEGALSGTRSRLVLAGVVVLAVVAFGTAALARMRAAKVPTGSLVVVADVDNLTGDSLFDRSLLTATTIGLQASKHVIVFPRARIRETLRRMRRPETDTIISEGVAREVAVRDGVSRVVALSVSRFDTVYLLSARLVDPASGRDVYATNERVASRAMIVEGLDAVVFRLRNALGEHAAPPPNVLGMPTVTTAALDALRAYADGQRAWTAGRYAVALDAFRRAVSIDSTFALAHAALADYHWINRNPALARAALAKARTFDDGLTEREEINLRIRAARYDGPATEEVRLLGTLVERYPERDTWYNYGSALMRQSRCAEAIPALQGAIRYDSLFTNAHINIATCHQFLGNYPAAVAEYALAQRSDSLALLRGNLNYEWGQAVLRVRGAAAAESVFRLMLPRPGQIERALGARSLALLAMYRGQYGDAARHLDSAIVWSRLGNSTLGEYRNHIIRATVLLTSGDTVRARDALQRASVIERTLSTNPFFFMLGAHGYARAGMAQHVATARARAGTFASPGLEADRENLRLMDAFVQASAGRYRRALEHLAESVLDSSMVVWARSLRADAYIALGHPDSALRELRAVPRTNYFGHVAQDEAHRIPLRIARLAERMGDTAAARASYDAYLTHFANGDADLPEVVETKRAVARLGARK